MMKTLKTVLITGLITFALCGVSYAQDINEAIKMYNDAVTALNNKDFKTALDNAQKALEIATATDVEEAEATKINVENLIPKIYYQEGRELINNKKYEEAVSALQKAAEVATKYNDNDVKDAASDMIPKVLMTNANTLLSASDFVKAVPAYEKVLALEPNNEMAYLRIGQAQVRLNNEEAAVAAFEKALELGAKDADKQLATVYLKKAVAGQTAKKWNDVFTNAESALKYDPENISANKLLGAAAIELKKWDVAISSYEKVLPSEKNPDNINYNLARAYEANGNKAKACEYYKKITGNPTFKAFAEAKVKELCG